MLSFDCMACDQEFEGRFDNTLINTFTEKPKYNYVLTVCPFCDQKFFLFFKSEMFLEFGYIQIEKERPDDWVIDIYRQLSGKKPKKREATEEPKQLPPGPTPDEKMDEIIIVKFHDWLEHTMPDDFVG